MNKLRKVLVKSPIESYEGWFHGFSQNYEEFDNGPGNFAAGIVERNNGKVETECAWFIQFLEPYESIKDSE